MNCRVCKQASMVIFSAQVLRKYEVHYHRCEACGFIQTDEPFWLLESYSSAINDLDLGSVARAIEGAKYAENLILAFLDHSAKFIDYGGGYGVFVRLMRDRGYQFFWKDMYCANLFAKHFEAPANERFELLTAFEVFEHLVDPIEQIARMLELSDSIAFSTLLVPQSIQVSSDWWYFSPEHGQHVSFFTRLALEVIARRFSLNLFTDGHMLHLLSRKSVSRRLFTLISENNRSTALVRRVLRRKLKKQSLLADDVLAVTGSKI